MSRKATIILFCTFTVWNDLLLGAEDAARGQAEAGAAEPWMVPWWLLIAVPPILTFIVLWILACLGFLRARPHYVLRVLGLIALGTLITGSTGGITISIFGEKAVAKWGADFTFWQGLAGLLSILFLGGYLTLDRILEHKQARSFAESPEQRGFPGDEPENGDEPES